VSLPGKIARKTRREPWNRAADHEIATPAAIRRTALRGSRAGEKIADF
jgi:hypothetical protein